MPEVTSAALSVIPRHEVDAAVNVLAETAEAGEISVAELARLRDMLAGLLARVDSALAEGEEAARRRVAEFQRARRPRVRLAGEDERPLRPLRDGLPGVRALPPRS